MLQLHPEGHVRQSPSLAGALEISGVRQQPFGTGSTEVRFIESDYTLRCRQIPFKERRWLAPRSVTASRP